MPITQKWHTSLGTACATKAAAEIRESAENLAVVANRRVPGLPVKLASDMLDMLMTEGKLLVPPIDADFDTLQDAFSQLTRYGTPYPGVVEAVEKIAAMNDDMAHGREPDGAKPYVEWRVE
jgi:hypothetical protein